jgi:hypothetical protein
VRGEDGLHTILTGQKEAKAMKQEDVEIGGVYAVKVTGNVVPVVIDEEHPETGWVGTNKETGRQVRIKTADRLRRRLQGEEGDEGAEGSEPEATAEEAENAATEGDTGADETAPEPEEAPAEENPQMSSVDAAAKVLEEADEPLGTREIYNRAEEASYWRSDGQTPWATIYSAIYREIRDKGEESRFEKVERGKFARAK